VKRYLQHSGFEVAFVRNVTDVDDKIIRKAADELASSGEDASGESLKQKVVEVSERYLKEYHQAMDTLGIQRPGYEPKATENIGEMIRFITELIEKDKAYVSGGNVYFDVESFDGYGDLSGQDIDQMKQGFRTAGDEDKRHHLDFALWKNVKPGEPYWESPWGEGRPGWHIECSVMSTNILGSEFDIHGGGLDLIFPHHENEIAQARAAGHPFARVWMHNGFLTVNGEKMSKSLGNFITVDNYFKEHPDPDLLKIMFLASHYRSPVDYSEDKVKEAAAAKSRITRFIKNVDLTVKHGESKNVLPSGQDVANSSFTKAMDDDFNTPGALSAIFEAVQLGYNFLAVDKIEEACKQRNFICECVKILGLSLKEDEREDKKIKNLIDKREYARNEKDFEKADAIRKELTEMGVVLADTREGTTLWWIK